MYNADSSLIHTVADDGRPWTGIRQVHSSAPCVHYMILIILCACCRHIVEFLIGEMVVPYHMTVFEAIRQFSLGGSGGGSSADSEDDITPLGRPDIWIKTHIIQ